jgi:hypothetical protein
MGLRVTVEGPIMHINEISRPFVGADLSRPIADLSALAGCSDIRIILLIHIIAPFITLI